jgi:hypothetical protein
MHHAMPRTIPHLEPLHAPHRLELPSLLTQSPDLVAPQIRRQQLLTVQDDLVSVRRLLPRVRDGRVCTRKGEGGGRGGEGPV